jgi:hypothetical protein
MDVLILGVVVCCGINEETSNGSRDISTSASRKWGLAIIDDACFLLIEIKSKKAVEQALDGSQRVGTSLQQESTMTYVFNPWIADYRHPAYQISLRFQVLHKLPLVRGHAYIVKRMVCTNSIVGWNESIDACFNGRIDNELLVEVNVVIEKGHGDILPFECLLERCGAVV